MRQLYAAQKIFKITEPKLPLQRELHAGLNVRHIHVFAKNPVVLINLIYRVPAFVGAT